jgi:hypothetical protein
MSSHTLSYHDPLKYINPTPHLYRPAENVILHIVAGPY